MQHDKMWLIDSRVELNVLISDNLERFTNSEIFGTNHAGTNIWSNIELVGCENINFPMSQYSLCFITTKNHAYWHLADVRDSRIFINNKYFLCENCG